MKERSPITTHILDTSKGKPAVGVAVVLEFSEGTAWKAMGKGQTNADGRVEDLLKPGIKLATGTYRLVFETKSFYPHVTIEFKVDSPSEHYHIPLLLSPYGYSTYRGS